MEEIKKFFKQDRFAAHCGIELAEVKPGYAKATMQAREEHLNGIGVVQGGAIFTLADLAFAVASNSHGTVAVAINVNISFVKAARPGLLTAEAKEVTCGKTIGTYDIKVTNEKGEIVSVFEGMAYRMKDELPIKRSENT